MVDIKEHIRFLRQLSIPYKTTLVRYCYTFFKEHMHEINDINLVLNEIAKPSDYVEPAEKKGKP